MNSKQLIFRLILFFTLPIIFMVFLYLLLYLFSAGTLPGQIEALLISTAEFTILFLLFGFHKFSNIKRLNTSPLQIKKLLFMVPLSIIVRFTAAAVLIIILKIGLFAGLEKQLEEGVKLQWEFAGEQTGLGYLVDNLLVFLTVVILAPIIEELLFRGVIFNALRKKINIAASIIITSLLFSLVHLHIGLLIITFITGVFLNYVYYKYGNIGYSIFLHMLINFFPFALELFKL